ncbi:MAG: hypothetical protein LBR16_02260 [Treponema sp.]|jgi:hypothetical protein|nr:hypothetical protein [Treponema sp.]
MKKRVFAAAGALLCGVLWAQIPGGQGFPGSGGLPGGGIPGMGGIPGAAGGAEAAEARIHSDMAMMKLDGLIPLRFGNALDGSAIPGASVEIVGVGTFFTDARGIAAFPVQPDGAYQLIFTKQGFIQTPLDFKIQTGQVIFNWFSISPGLLGDYRFVLNWGDKPKDLDIHLEKAGGYHISYQNMREYSDEEAKLDRDDRDSYGPETVTLAKLEAKAVYHLYIVDYTNSGKRNSTALSESGATVLVYNQNRLLRAFRVPQGKGFRWNVCKIERGAVVPVNTVTGQ